MKKQVFTLIFIFNCFISFAQQLPIDNHYVINKYSLSPAYSGATKNMEALIGYRQNWVGIDGAPEKQAISLNGPISETSGWGINFTHEQTGNFSHFYGAFSYAYHMEMSKSSHISFGLAGEVYRNQIELKKVRGQIEDPALMQNEVLAGTTFNASFGIAYRSGGLNIGWVVPRILESKMNYTASNNFTMAREFLFHASYWTKTGGRRSKVDIEPYVIVRMTQNSGLHYEAAARIRYLQRIWIAPGYRNSAVILNAGAALGANIVMNYSYEYGLSGIAGLASGTHEVALGFLINRHRRGRRGELSIFVPDKRTPVQTEEKKDNPEVKKMAAQLDSTNKKLAELEKKLEEKEKELAEKQDEEKPKPEADYGNPFVLKNIKFSNNSERLYSSSFPTLNKLAAKMIRNPKMKIKITGHTDNKGSTQYNLKLSKRRAEAVKKYLVERRRIDPSRIVTEGKGETEPLAPNTTEQGRAKNRRIEGRFKKS
ncbi:MAG: hypothetical protein CSA05_01870 [Bacteroidia bacterium]|nr:MAG: hypothetical protein CSA05_01870 [Bacteroidia bacterium]